MIDPLVYDVQLRLDPDSLARVRNELNELTERTQVEAQQQQAEAIKMTAEALKSFNAVSRDAATAGSSQVKSLADLSKRLDEAKTELASYTKQQQMGLPLTDDDIRKRESLKLKVKDLSAEYNKQQREALALANTTKGTAETYEDLQAQNKALAVEMRKMPLNDTTGNLAKMQAQYKANTDRLKAFDATMGHHQRNVGNYASALDDVGGKLSGMPGPIGRASGAFSAFSQILKANPLILVATAVAGLLSTLTRVQVVVDGVNVVFKGLDATLNVVGARIASLGSGLVSILRGNFREGIGQIKDSFTGLATEIRETYVAGAQAEQMLQRLARAQNEAMVREAVLTRDIANARLLAQDAELPASERLAAIEQAIALNQRLAQSERSIAQQRLAAAQEKLKTDTDDLQLQTELAQARVELIRVETDLANRQRELFEKRNTLSRQVTDEERRRQDDILAREAELERRRLAIIDSLGEQTRQRQQAEFDEFVRLQQAKTEREEADAKRQAEIEARVAQERLSIQRSFYSIATNLANGFFGANKAIAIATTIIDTIVAAQAVYKDTKGGPFARTLAATAALAQGYARVRAIQRTNVGSSSTPSSTAPSVSARPEPAPRPSRPELPRDSFGEVDTVGMTPQSEKAPVVILSGELDSELLAIKVRHGSDAVSARGITIGR